MASKLVPSERIKDIPYNMWTEFITLAVEHKALNFGVGYPDFEPPENVITEGSKILATSPPGDLINQYARGVGHIPFVNALAKYFSPLFSVNIDPLKEITVGPGADIGIYFALQSFVNPNDEVILIEPFFDCYKPMTEMTGAIPVYVTLKPPNDNSTDSGSWKLDRKELEGAFSSKTKAIIINTPLNPIGKVFSREELTVISELCIKYDVLCISDEVYQFLTYDGLEHVRIASLPGMWERTVTIGSAGKAFCVTGWKLGWYIAPSKLTEHLHTTSGTIVYSSNKPLQETLARAFEREFSLIGKPESFFTTLLGKMQSKRDRLVKTLRKIGLTPIIPQGSFYLIVDGTSLNIPEINTKDGDTYDKQLVRWLIVNKSVATIPVSAYYIDQHKHCGENYIRFCFAKKESSIDKLGEIFDDWIK